MITPCRMNRHNLLVKDEKMTNSEYHALNSISASMLKTAQKSMKHFWAEYIDPNRKPKEQTPAMKFGSWLHDHILGTNEYDFVVLPDGIDKRTKEGKAFFAELEASGKTTIKQEEYDILESMKESINAHKVSNDLYSHHAVIEAVFQWQENGVNMRMKPDIEIAPCADYPNGLIVDLKTTTDATAHGFSRDAYNLGYHIQAAHYSVGFMHKYNTNEYPEFYFLAIEKNSPFICQYFKADDQLVSYGFDVRSELIEKINQTSISGIYEGYNDHSVTPLELPQWVKRQIESADEEVEGIEYV